ncbi:putative serine protease 47 [Erinaceus europaeus]|uniref:Serine protease 47 n=1 Tax=Erinaceus europaeus TaxID=9365 RepID=A0ABM3Y1M3_ERIEU|nr:putative serine protease 47 [Erinaceus europaeus]
MAEKDCQTVTIQMSNSRFRWECGWAGNGLAWDLGLQSLIWSPLSPPHLTAREAFSTVCGKPMVMGRIYGGQEAEAGQWPWQASLLYQGSHICGAVLIGSRWLVTTAHCFANKSQAPMDYWVVLGDTQLYQHTQHTQKMAVSRIVIHPDFEKFHFFGSDIAMLQLYLPVKSTSYVVPACLPTPDLRLPRDTSCWITGWGMLTEDTRLPPPFPLQESKVNIIENKVCNILYGERSGQGDISIVQEEMLCAGDILTGKAICQGDSGGPLVCSIGNTWFLMGLASWGLDCRHPIYPSIFTRVTYFANWINETQRLTPLPNLSATPSQTPPPGHPMKAASSPGPCTISGPWLLLLMVHRGPGQALW